MKQQYTTRVLRMFALLLTAQGSLLAQGFSNPGSGSEPVPIEAINPILFVELYSTDGTCGGSIFEITVGWTATIADPGDGNDVVGMIAYDSFGVPIAANWNGWRIGDTATVRTDFGDGDGINEMTGRPIKIEVYDIVTFPPFGSNTQAIFDDILAQSATVPLLIEMVFDPTDLVPDCTNLPEASTVPTLDTIGLITLVGLLLVATFVIRRRRQG